MYWFYYGFSRSARPRNHDGRIASTAPGYVELCGEAFQLPGTNPLLCTLTAWPVSGTAGTASHRNRAPMAPRTRSASGMNWLCSGASVGAVIVALERHV